MSKEEKIEDIKNVSEFYQALRNNVANTFNDYERCGIFDGWTENQKKECFHFGTHILSNVWLPIQKHYTNKERKKYEKIVNKYEDICKRQDQQIAELKHQLAEKDKEIEELKLNNKKYFTDSCRVNKEIAYKLKQQNQKAIEQLEKIKELCKNKFEWWENSEWEGNIYDKSDVSNAYFDIEANIDQQIASLKKGVQ